MQTDNVRKVLAGEKTTTVRSDRAATHIGLHPGECGIVEWGGTRVEVRYRGCLSVAAAGGRARMEHSEGFGPDGPKYAQTRRWLAGEGELHVYDLHVLQRDRLPLQERPAEGDQSTTPPAGTTTRGDESAVAEEPPVGRKTLGERLTERLAQVSSGKTNSKYARKDLLKALLASQMIGQGSPGSSTARYSEAAGELANTGRYHARDVVFVSVNGQRGGRFAPLDAEGDHEGHTGTSCGRCRPGPRSSLTLPPHGVGPTTWASASWPTTSRGTATPNWLPACGYRRRTRPSSETPTVQRPLAGSLLRRQSRHPTSPAGSCSSRDAPAQRRGEPPQPFASSGNGSEPPLARARRDSTRPRRA